MADIDSPGGTEDDLRPILPNGCRRRSRSHQSPLHRDEIDHRDETDRRNPMDEIDRRDPRNVRPRS